MKNENQISFPFEVFEEELANPLFGHQLSEVEAFISRLLLDASSEKPIQIREVISRVESSLGRRINEREVKDTVRSLRRNHAFPILSRRGAPAGYYWCSSTQEMKEFSRRWMASYFDEMVTLSIIVKHNFPRLAGQMRIADIPKKE